MTAYRCPNKRVDARAVYTNTVPAGAFRGYGLSQTVFAVESAVDELARLLGLDPVEFRRRNLLREGDAPDNASGEPGGRVHGEPGRRRMPRPRREGAGERAGRRLEAPDGWLAGTGIAVALLDTIPPGGHPGRAKVAERAGRRVQRLRRDGGIRQRHGHRPPAARRGRAGLRRRPTSLSCPPTPTGAGTTRGRTGRRASWWRAPRPCGRRGPWPRRSTARTASGSADGKLLEAEGYCDGLAAVGVRRRAGVPGGGRARARARSGSCSRCRRWTRARC